MGYEPSDPTAGLPSSADMDAVAEELKAAQATDVPMRTFSGVDAMKITGNYILPPDHPAVAAIRQSLDAKEVPKPEPTQP
jgi:hypothetical protein